MKGGRFVPLIALLAVGCAPAPETASDPAGPCDAAPAQGLIGQSATSGLAAEARRLSGAAVVRWLQPGQMVTMEYRADRLSIQLDERNAVTAIRCG